MATETTLMVFAHLGQDWAPSGQLQMTEEGPTVLASTFAYGLNYARRPDALEVDPVSLSLQDRAQVLGKRLPPANTLPLFGGIRDAAPDAWHKPAGWNGRLIYNYGGGCSSSYSQSTNNAPVLREDWLGLGFAVASATFNTFGNNCNDVLSAETTMMVREHFIDRYGPRRVNASLLMVAAAGGDVAVEARGGDVEAPPREPARVRRLPVEDAVVGRRPGEGGGPLAPERLRIGGGPGVHLGVVDVGSSREGG